MFGVVFFSGLVALRKNRGGKRGLKQQENTREDQHVIRSLNKLSEALNHKDN